MVTARLGLVTVYTTGVPAPGLLERSLDLNTEAVAMARRLGDRGALGYALNARLSTRCGALIRRPNVWRRRKRSGRSQRMSATGSWRCRGTCGASVSCWRRVTSIPSMTRSLVLGARQRPGPPVRHLASGQRGGHDGAGRRRHRGGGIARGTGASELARTTRPVAHRLPRRPDDVDLVAARRALLCRVFPPRGDRPEPDGLSQCARRPRPGACRGGRDGRGTRGAALARRPGLEQYRRPERERDLGPDCRGLRPRWASALGIPHCGCTRKCGRMRAPLW